MISIAIKRFSSSFLNPNSFLCKSNAHFFPSIHLFSTSRSETPIPSSEIYSLLVDKHQFSPESASLASSRLPQFKTPETADSILSFLKANSFTAAQLETIVDYNPQILGLKVDDIKSRLSLFQDLGLSSQEVAKIFTSNRMVLRTTLPNTAIPSLSILKSLMGSNDEVGRLLRKSVWFFASNLEKVLVPNVEMLKSCGMPMKLIRRSIHLRPRCFLIKPCVMRKSIDRAIEMGVSRDSVAFITAVEVFAWMSEEMWEVKMQFFRDMGFSDDDVLEMFRKQPLVLLVSTEKAKSVVELLLATKKYDISNFVNNPASLGYSIERRLGPRLHILGVLESRDLIQDWPGIAALCQYKNDKFFDRFVRPYVDEIGQEWIDKMETKMKEGMKL